MMSSFKVTNPSNTPISQVQINPVDSTQISVLGQSLFRTLRYQEGQLKQFYLNNRTESKVFLSHCWVTEQYLVVGTENGKVLVIDGSEVKIELDAVCGGKPVAVQAIIAYSKGFICGGSNNAVLFFDRVEEKEMFVQTREHTVCNDERSVKDICISPNEDFATCALTNGEMYILALGQQELLKVNISLLIKLGLSEF